MLEIGWSTPISTSGSYPIVCTTWNVCIPPKTQVPSGWPLGIRSDCPLAKVRVGRRVRRPVRHLPKALDQFSRAPNLISQENLLDSRMRPSLCGECRPKLERLWLVRQLVEGVSNRAQQRYKNCTQRGLKGCLRLGLC